MQHSDCGMYASPDWVATLWICKSLQFLWNFTAILNRIVWKYYYCVHSRKKGGIFARTFHKLARWENSHLEKQNLKSNNIYSNGLYTPRENLVFFFLEYYIYISERGFLLIANKTFINIYYLVIWYICFLSPSTKQMNVKRDFSFKEVEW